MQIRKKIPKKEIKTLIKKFENVSYYTISQRTAICRGKKNWKIIKIFSGDF